MQDSYNVNHEFERKKALNIILSQSRQQDREDAEVIAEARRITEARLKAKVRKFSNHVFTSGVLNK